ncbi:MarR family winged helix-turn-helix transcriptional regulator [Gordonia polyisoprenivorans]|uniref:MarR family winged helix-turn-helix transcriptional regulator n=1 Tax=Gordonia polyisoprenivorans TaxID=84595 RepID=UPI001AD7B45E|nr:MarR family transcriptional regulator [Gordonia polyisoprenivorans]QTI69131.1 MarR family transcriptional regulator [Gordonia polyisoprenivorans]
MATPRLDDQLCFALYAASRAVIAAQRPGLQELGLTYPQYLVMLVMWEERSVPVGRLCERLHLDSGTVSPLVRRLEGAGLVERRRSTEDERSIIVELTPAGSALGERSDCVLAALLEGLTAAADQSVQPEFVPDDVVPLRSLLHNLIGELDRLNNLDKSDKTDKSDNKGVSA